MAAKISSSTKRIYRKRVSKSPCRGKKNVSCKKSRGCKVAKGKKRSFCRKQINTKRNKSPSFRVTRRKR